MHLIDRVCNHTHWSERHILCKTTKHHQVHVIELCVSNMCQFPHQYQLHNSRWSRVHCTGMLLYSTSSSSPQVVVCALSDTTHTRNTCDVLLLLRFGFGRNCSIGFHGFGLFHTRNVCSTTHNVCWNWSNQLLCVEPYTGWTTLLCSFINWQFM